MPLGESTLFKAPKDLDPELLMLMAGEVSCRVKSETDVSKISFLLVIT